MPDINNKPAFPTSYDDGATMREMVAVELCRAFIQPLQTYASPEKVAKLAVRYTDELLKELAKPQNDNKKRKHHHDQKPDVSDRRD